MVQFFDGTIEEYQREIESQNAQERMRNERIWNRGEFLNFLESFILAAFGAADRGKVTTTEYATMHDYCLAYVKANMPELYEEYSVTAGHDLWLSLLHGGSLSELLSKLVCVESSFSHEFEGDDEDQNCRLCGARYRIALHPTRAGYKRYHANNGDDPMDCYDLRGKVHGIERNCEVNNGQSCTEYGEPCEHTEHDCNCVSCA